MQSPSGTGEYGPRKMAPAFLMRLTTASASLVGTKEFGGVGVGRVDGLVETVGQHDGRLGAGQRRAGHARRARRAATRCFEALPAPCRQSRRSRRTGTDPASSSCSAWPMRSAASRLGLAVSSAMMPISVGPATASMPTNAETSDLAVATKMLPGPVILSTGSHRMSPSCGSLPLAPYANMAMA